MSRKKIILLLVMLCCFVTTGVAQEMYEYNTYYSASGDSLLYRSLKPKVKKGKKYPLVLFLHGAGQKGNDNEKQLSPGSELFTNPDVQEKYPSYVIFPQCPKNDYWAYDRVPKNFDNLPYADKMNPTLTLVKELLDEILRTTPSVDKSRIYVMGFSMGGVGTYDIVSRYPEMFAAAVPLCGAIAPGHLGAAKDVKFRIFHGDKDPTVPVKCSRRVQDELKAIGAEFEYIEFPGAKHGICGMTFRRPDFIDWIFAQKKGKRMARVGK